MFTRKDRGYKKIDDREKLKQELLEELKSEYIMTPIKEKVKEKAFTVKDIADKYEDEIKNKFLKNKSLCERNLYDFNFMSTIWNAIRKVVALHLGFYTTKDINELEDRQEYRAEFEKFIKEYILKED